MDDDNIDSILNANGFELCSEIGHGGFSYCYKVYSTLYKQYFVCKIVPASIKKHAGEKVYNNELKEHIAELQAVIEEDKNLLDVPSSWIAIKLLENDEIVEE